MRFVCLSDTHTREDMDIPSGDVLLFAGDMAMFGDEYELRAFRRLLDRLPFKHKIVIAGNHDVLFERDPIHAQRIFQDVTYLCDSCVTIHGIKIYGTPWQPAFMQWAFNLPRGSDALRAKIRAIPDDADIVLTHSPPLGHGDLNLDYRHDGCADLLTRIQAVRPAYHVFGHIHEGYGETTDGITTYINASALSQIPFEYNPCITFDL